MSVIQAISAIVLGLNGAVIVGFLSLAFVNTFIEWAERREDRKKYDWTIT